MTMIKAQELRIGNLVRNNINGVSFRLLMFYVMGSTQISMKV
jgi:hypothetical protein